MHAVKISWVGQTFALAKSNDSGGKKSRIRRSKEERKSMVESFIKRYQESNNGNFPSLNLTHKEVGGSFYTVREIVREIIQENRVLGPAKFSEDPISDEFSEQYPLGSISTEPQSHLFFSADNNFLISTDEEIVTKEVVSSSTLDFHFTSHEQQSFDNGRLINGKVVDEENNNMDATKLLENRQFRKNISDPSTINMEVQVGENLDEVKNVAEASVAKVTPIAAGIIVETFPIRTGTKPTFRMDENSETKVSTGSLKEVETTMVEVAPEINDDLFDVEKKSSGSDDKLATEKTADPILESTVHTTVRTSLGSQDVDVPKNDILTLQTSDQCLEDAGIQPKVSPPEVHTKNFDAINSGSTGLESLQTEVAGSKTKAHTQHVVSTNEGSTSTLNRINLRSWDSKKSAKEEINPVWAVFKAFIDAFVKFWSE